MRRFIPLSLLLALISLSAPVDARASISPYADYKTALAYSGSATAELAASMISEMSTTDPLIGPTLKAASLLDAGGNVTNAVSDLCAYTADDYVAENCENMTNGAQVAAFVFAFLYSQAIVIELFFNNEGGGLGLPFITANNPIITLVFVSAYFEVLNVALVGSGHSNDFETSIDQNGGNTEVTAEGSSIAPGTSAGIAVTLMPTMMMAVETKITGIVDANNDLGNGFNEAEITAQIQAPPSGSISGLKWRDDNGDGFIDDGEPGVPGWTIMMDGPGGPVQTTNENGEYSFDGLEPGQYTLSEGSQTGWVQTFPGAEDDGGHVVDLASGQNAEQISFGNQQLGAIKVVKYIDVDGDGVLDETEPFADGWTMKVDGPDIEEMEEVTVVDTGEALFENLPPGEGYTVTEVQMEGWDNRDSQVTQMATVLPGETTEVFFGNFRYGEIVVTKFEDTNGNGTQDEGEEPIEGWDITLEGEGGSTQPTDGQGSTTFGMLKPGTKTITEEDREGWAPSSGELSTEIELIHGETEEISIGNYRPGKITVVKYEDLNGNGVQDDGEPGLEGWEITVDGETMETDGSGMVMFDGLEPDEYDVSEEVVDPWKVSQGPNPQTVLIESGDEKEVVFGNYRPAKITVFKFRDEDGDGVRDPGDSPVSGWDITCSGGSCDAGVTQQTAGDGSTMFTDLDPGDYTISEGTRAGWTQTSPAGNFMRTLESGDEIELTFLNEPPDVPNPGSIHAQKFLDADGDGVFDPGEVGLNGVTIRLNGGAQTQVTHDMDLNSDGTIDPRTERGWVWFVDLPAGNYTLDEVVPTGMTITTPVGNIFNIALGEGEVNDQSKFGNIPLGDGLDFGDAPEDEETPPDPDFPDGYPTRLANDGAAHVIDPEVYLGEYIDAESDGLPTLPANGDDEDEQLDDEDGVEFGDNFVMRSVTLPGDTEETSVPGQVRGTTARIIFFPSVDGRIDAWVDWNRDGDWDDDGEQMYEKEPVMAESDTLDWVVPGDASDGYTYARFRYTLDGAESYSGIEFVGEVEDYLMYTQAEGVDIERREDSELPRGYNLEQNYPNPFNPVTTFTFAVPESEFVTIDVFDLLGKHVANVVNRQVPLGEYSVQFDASALPSGTYVYRMTAGAFTETKQFTLLK